MNKVNEVITIVFNKLTKLDKEKLPSNGTKSRFITEALALAQLQVAEEMIHTVKSNSGICLHSDGATKHHTHFQNFQVTTTNGTTLSSGLCGMAGSVADFTVMELTKLLGDICDILELNLYVLLKLP